MKFSLVLGALAVMPALAAPSLALALAIPTSFAPTKDDKRMIEELLATYTQAVSNKDQALFESLLLSKTIPFSGTGPAVEAAGKDGGTSNYELFRKGVFEGPPFTQTFRDVEIHQDGPLASVSLVFINAKGENSSWGWKVMQLLKVGDRWRIASEFFTLHK